MSGPVTVYLGTQVEQSLAADVLTYSIGRHTQQPVQVKPLYEAVATAGIEIPVPKNPRLRPRTPFTFQRFAIPALCGYRGRALYLDSDMLVFRDIRTLWQQPFEGAQLLSVPEPPGSQRPPQYSVMLLNCEQLPWAVTELVAALEAGKWTYTQLVLEMAAVPLKAATLPLGWNDLERYDPARTALLHYTDMPRQPWLSIDNPLAYLWCDMLLEAIAEGAISLAAVEDSVNRNWVRPSLLYQIAHGIADPRQLPEPVQRADCYRFAPPHVWQKYLRYPLLQGARSRQWFSRAYATLKTTAGKMTTGKMTTGATRGR